MDKVKIGIMGCGRISSLYFRTFKKFNFLTVVACADKEKERALATAKEFGISKACTVQELLADPKIEIIINLTPPQVHAKTGMMVIEAGKNLYNEKPLAVNRQEADCLLKAAKANNVILAGAPETFMFGTAQACRKIIDDGLIGTPIGASVFFLAHGHENWHPEPDFYYKPGGGPMYDMGVYYITELVNLLGPVVKVTSSEKISFPERVITSQPKFGEKIKVEVPTYISGIMEFAQGAIVTITATFDVWATQLPTMEVYGTEATLVVAEGVLPQVKGSKDSAWAKIPVNHGYTEHGRGLGVAEMACALRTGRTPRVNGELAYHVLDVMQSFDEAALAGKHVQINSTCSRPQPLPIGLKDGDPIP